MNSPTTFSQEEMRVAQGRVFKYPLELLDEIFVRVSDYIPEFEDYYFVSNYGRVCSWYTGSPIILNTSVHPKNGYVSLILQRKSGGYTRVLLHRLVMLCFHHILNSDEMEVNHKDGIKTHNYDTNLEWTTNSENIVHAYENNLIPKGEQRSHSVITEMQAHEICKLIEKGYRTKDISYTVFGDYTNNHRQIIQNIRFKASWKDVSKNYDMSTPNQRCRLLSDDQLIYLKSLIDNNPQMSAPDILRISNIDISQMDSKQLESMCRIVRSIKNKSAYSHIFENDN